MTAQPPPSPEVLSSVCLECGLCCDGTLFSQAPAEVHETPSYLVAIGLTPVSRPNGEPLGFRLPCPHFSDRCEVYGNRPYVCGHYRCALLKSVERGSVQPERAIEIVRNAKALRASLPSNLAELADEAGVENPADAPHSRPSLFRRAFRLVPTLLDPDRKAFREKYASELASVFAFATIIRQHFVPAPQAAMRDPESAADPSPAPPR